jgi:hypothetical protein
MGVILLPIVIAFVLIAVHETGRRERRAPQPTLRIAGLGNAQSHPTNQRRRMGVVEFTLPKRPVSQPLNT